MQEVGGGSSTPRFVRVNRLRSSVAGAIRDNDEAALTSLLQSAQPVRWLPGFDAHSLPPGVPIASTDECLGGAVAGVDAASLAAVGILNPAPGERILDICTAPGAKLAAIATRMNARGHLVGVDVSAARLGTACTLAHRYRVVACGELQPQWRCRLYKCDATAWSPLAATAGASQHTPRLPVLDSLVENMFRKAHAQGARGMPPPFVPQPRAVEGLVSKLVRARGAEGLREAIRHSQPEGRHHACSTLVEDEKNEAAGGQSPKHKRARVEEQAGGVDEGGPAAVDTSPPPTSAAPPDIAPDDEEEASLVAGLLGALSCPPPALYDRVLVDAQCTHDGSLRHVAKAQRRKLEEGAAKGGGTRDGDAAEGDDGAVLIRSPSASFSSGASSSSSATTATKELDANALSNPSADAASSLRALQRGLLASGFRWLRPGGCLVYSTCSMDHEQNERVVAWLLASHPDALLVPIDTAAGLPQEGGASVPVDGKRGEEQSDPVGTLPLPDGSANSPPTGSSAAAAEERRGWDAARWQQWHAQSPVPPWIASDELPGTVRFDPYTSGTSGLFVARLTKRAACGGSA